jgi:hypothetical protein
MYTHRPQLSQYLLLLSVLTLLNVAIVRSLGQEKFAFPTQNSRRSSSSLAFFAWPDSFKLGSKKACNVEQGNSQGTVQGDSYGREARLRGGSTAESVPGPTTRPLTQAAQPASPFQGEQGSKLDIKEMAKTPIGSSLSELISMLQAQESALMMQASRCRAATQRLIFIQQLFYTKIYSKGGEPKSQAELEEEVVRWRLSTYDMHRQLNKCLVSAGKNFAELLGELPLSLPDVGIKSADLQGALDSAVTPEHHSEEDEDVTKAKAAISQGPTIRTIDRKRALDTQV